MAQYSRHLRDNPSDFPYDFEKQILSKQSADTIYHWHPELEIIYVKKGTATLYINSERFESHGGDIFLIQPTSPHAINQYTLDIFISLLGFRQTIMLMNQFAIVFFLSFLSLKNRVFTTTSY